MGSEAFDEAKARGLAVTHWATETPDQMAVVGVGGTLTFAELDRRANQVVNALFDRGLAPGDSVALMLTNRTEYVEVWCAVQRSGLRLTPINFHLTGDEAGYIVDDCGAKAFVADGSDPTLAKAAAIAATHAPNAEVRLAIGGPIEGFDDYEVTTGDASDAPPAEPQLGKTMFYTSGTTGRPKGVTHDGRPNPPLNIAFVLPGHVHLCPGPLYHAAPLTFSLAATTNFGGGVVVMDHWDPAEFLRLIPEHGVTHSHLVPTMFHRLLQLPQEVRDRADTSSLALVLHGAAPCPIPVKEQMIEWWGNVIVEYYAATEGSASVIDSATWMTKKGSVGKPVDEQAIVGDADANPLPAGEIGLVWLKAPASGRFHYHGADDKTQGAYRGDRFTLGDHGYLDDDGFLFLTGRSVELVISGGVNIYPAEVDEALVTHPAVGDGACFGLPNEEWGEELVAVVELRAGIEPSPALADELIAHCRDNLAHYKCPRRVEFTDHLPRLDSGKVSRVRLREAHLVTS